MTIIFRIGSEFWIEQHEIVRSSIGAGAFANTTITLDKGGHYVGCAIRKDTGGSAVTNQLISVLVFRTVGGDQLLYGEPATTVLIQRSNNNVGAELVGAEILVFMTK